MQLRSRKYWLAVSVAVLTFLVVGIIDLIFARYHMRRDATYLDDLLLAVLAGIFVFALERFHEREVRRLSELANLVAEMNHHIRNALQVISYAHQTNADAQYSEEVSESISRIEWVLREVLCESAIRMGVQSVAPEMAARKRTAD